MKIGILQLNSQLDPKTNLEKIKSYASKIKNEGVVALFLPEYFYSFSAQGSTPFVDPLEDICQLARTLGVFLVGGSAVTKVGDRLYNRAYNISPNGELLSYYDKINLFVCNLQSASYDESKHYTGGTSQTLLTLEGHEDFTIGMSLCFDLRFPEHFRAMSGRGANVLSIAAAFTVPTGLAHWHTLVRARAIENQAYVIAAAQCGVVTCNSTRKETFGHSLVVDPWGEVLIDAGASEEGPWFCDLQRSLIDDVRSRMKVL
ncbi:MAG: hypothetical protein HQK50_17140 [Oligoflexia bacterium]|nr:hypothetical protein [Oligoflexia bacterium]